MTALWIVGAGGHGRVVADAAMASGRWESLSFFDDRWPAITTAGDLQVAGTLATLKARLAGSSAAHAEVIVAIGDNARRLEVSDELAAAGARLATVVHPFSAISASATIEPGSVVLAGAVLNPGVRVGRACIVNTRASIDHDCEIGNGIHVCPGVTLAGNVCVQDLVWIGIGSCTIQGISIGHSAVVGAGAAVVDDVRPGTTVVGCPARETKLVS